MDVELVTVQRIASMLAIVVALIAVTWDFAEVFFQIVPAWRPFRYQLLDTMRQVAAIPYFFGVAFERAFPVSHAFKEVSGSWGFTILMLGVCVFTLINLAERPSSIWAPAVPFAAGVLLGSVWR